MDMYRIIGSRTYKVLLGSTRYNDIPQQGGKSLTGG